MLTTGSQNSSKDGTQDGSPIDLPLDLTLDLPKASYRILFLLDDLSQGEGLADTQLLEELTNYEGYLAESEGNGKEGASKPEAEFTVQQVDEALHWLQDRKYILPLKLEDNDDIIFSLAEEGRVLLGDLMLVEKE